MIKKHYKIIVAPDSFKGSISSFEAALAIKLGLINSSKYCMDVITVPIADGGEGTLDAIVHKDNKIAVNVLDPLGRVINAEYGFIGKTAVIEMAKASGLTLLKEEERRAYNTNTFGVGEMILDAINHGFREFMITLGGSATNDGGCGMFAALGAKYYDKNGVCFVPSGGTLSNIAKIDVSELNSNLFDCTFTIATDVTNELTGSNGATMVYGKQKGASGDELMQIEKGMENYANILHSMTGFDVRKIKGSGAAGGMAIPLIAFFGAKIQSGIEAVLQAVSFDNLLNNADIVITGEGKIDRQSLFGKAISGITKHAECFSVPVYCFVGCIDDDINEIKKLGIADVFSISDKASSIEDSIKNAKEYLYQMAKDFASCL